MPTVVQISEFTIPDCNFIGTAAKLRRYYNSDWTDEDGVLHIAGTPGSSTGFFDEVDCTLANNTVTVPAFNATPTLTALINPNVRETWELWDEGGSSSAAITGDGGWFIPASPNPTTREILAIANQGQTQFWAQRMWQVWVQQLIDAQVPAPAATTVMPGIGRISAPSAVAGDPVFLEQNDPAVAAPASTADSKAVSAGTRASVADSKAVSDSGLISTAQSGVISSSVAMSSLTSRVSSNE